MSELFRAEAIAARREANGPGRLLKPVAAGLLWLLLAALLAIGVVAGLAIQVPVYTVSRAAGRPTHYKVVRTGEEPLLLFLWREVA